MNDLLGFEIDMHRGGEEQDPAFIKFSVELSDAFSQAQTIRLLFWPQGDVQTWVTLHRNPDNGIFEGEFALNPLAQSDLYEVRSIRAISNEGSEVDITDTQIEASGFSNSFDFYNEFGDELGPVVDDASFLTPIRGDDGTFSLSVRFNVSDEGGAGIDTNDVVVEIEGPGGESYFSYAQVGADGIATAAFALNQYSPSGTYRVNTIRVADNALNLTMARPDAAVWLNNPDGDPAAPSLSNFDAAFALDESDRPVLEFSMRWSDDGAGADRAYIRVYLPDGGHQDRWIYLDGDGRAQGTVDLGIPAAAGTYRIELTGYDRAGNQVRYYSDDLSALELPGFLTVEGPEDWGIASSIQASIGGAAVYGSTQGDTIVATETGNALFGNAGNDQLIGGTGRDRLFGGSGDDLAEGGGGADHIVGGFDNDVLQGEDGNDTIDGGEGDDILEGGAGWDTLEGGDGKDTLVGGNGNDRASYLSASAGVTVSLALSSAQDTRGAGVDTLASIEYLTGSFFADTLIGDENGNILSGEFGNDWLNGGDGRDYLYGGAGWDTFDGGGGNDLLNGGNGNDRASYLSAWAGVTVSLALEGAQNTLGSGWDTLVSIEDLTGSVHADVLTGSDDDNQIFGAGGADHVIGGFGDDLLLGQDGDDVIEGQAGWDMLRGDDGNDTLIGGNGGDLLLGGDGIDTLSGNSGFDRIYGGSGGDIISGGADRDLLFGEGGDDTISGDGGNDLLQGHNGEDVLDGGAGNDVVNGGAGNDTLLGGDGDDILIGNWGIDTMTGGTGADTFLFKAGHTGSYAHLADTILDFSQADGDIIDLSQIDALAGGGDDAFA
ncbi:hypothetical protein GRI69_04320, partial [Erythrobacter vulgaris]